LACLTWFALGWVLAAALRWRGAEAPAAWNGELRDLAVRAGVRRAIDLRVSRDERGPLTVGIFHSTVLLPPSAVDWSADQRRLVLLHELAHIVRHDCRSQAVAHVACAVHWFNPLVWLAARELRRERERACDEIVLRHGTKPSDYAACLLDVAAAAQSRSMPSAALAMARRSELEGRLLAILSHRARESSRTTTRLVPLGVVAASLALLAAQPVASGPPEADLPSVSASARRLPAPSPDEELSRQATKEAARTLRSAAAPEERSRAALALADSGQSAVSPLVRALEDPSADVREKAALALGLQSDRSVVPHLLRALTDPDAQVREKAALGLALRRDASVVEPLVAALGDPDGQVREKAAIALGTTADPRARAALEGALKDPDSQVREKAVAGLTMLGSVSPAEVDDLREGLRGFMGMMLRLTR
jgi:HEAT repeat protein